MSDKSQYAAAAGVPLIKSPSLRVPKPVTLPQDIHPLPDSFAYPFTLEPHIITLESSRRGTIAAHTARREAYLNSRTAEIERRKREAVQRKAPGLGTLLVPTIRATPMLQRQSLEAQPSQTYSQTGLEPESGGQTNGFGGQSTPRSVMDDLVDQLAALESRTPGLDSTLNMQKSQHQYGSGAPQA